MPIQAPQWTDYLICPVCCREFGAPPRSPISLGCGHTLCRHCLKHLHRKQCPFDQTLIVVEADELVVNTALLQLAGYTPPAQPYHPPSIQALPEQDRLAYDRIVRSMEHLAVYLKFCGNANNSTGVGRLSRPMQRKLVTLLQCCVTDEEARGRAARAARSLAERSVTELILHHQNPQQLSANLWAAVRARGCQFLGPAMQEEVLKLVLLALEDGSALSRKVLVMFVVQRLEPHFPQASKTSIGHVVQLLYRASCFKVSKRESDSSLMQLKEEFRSYESLRREHDAQIVQIATESGLRIAPDQWSALLYGDTAHKSHMQSIIDKLQTPQSFAQSVQELFIALQRTGDPAKLVMMSMHLDTLATIDASPDAKSPSWQQLAEIMSSLKEVVSGLVHYLQQLVTGRDSNHNQKHTDKPPEPLPSQSSPLTVSTPTHNKYKISMCRDAAARLFCPRGNTCTFAHSEEELERYAPRKMYYTRPHIYRPHIYRPHIYRPHLRLYRVAPIPQQNGNYSYIQPMPAPLQMYPRFPIPPPHHHHHIDYVQPIPLPPQPPQNLPQDSNLERPMNYPPPMIHSHSPITINPNGLLIPITERPFFARYGGMVSIPDEASNMSYREDYLYTNNAPMQFLGHNQLAIPRPLFQPPVHNNICRPAFPFDDLPSPIPAGYPNVQQRDRQPIWPQNSDTFNFEAMQNTLPLRPNVSEDVTSHTFNFDAMPNTLPLRPSAAEDATNLTFEVSSDRRAVGADRTGHRNERLVTNMSTNGSDDELEEELQELIRRIDTEF